MLTQIFLDTTYEIINKNARKSDIQSSILIFYMIKEDV